MPRVTIPGVGDVQFPDNMSRDEIMSQAQAMQQRSNQPILDPKDLPMSDLIKGGFSRGIEGLKGTAFDLIPALTASRFGRDEYAKEQLKEYADRMAAEEAVNPTAYKSYKDVKGIGDVLPFVGETFGELGPDILGLVSTGGAGAVVGKQIAKKGIQGALADRAAEYAARRGLTGEAATAAGEQLSARAAEKEIQKRAISEGARVGSQTGLIGGSLATNVPDVFQSIYEATGNLEPGLALIAGPLVAMLDTYLPGKILSQLGPAGKAALAKELLDKSNVVPTTWKKAFGAELAKTIAGEGGTEGLQEAITIAAEQIAGDKKQFFSPENVDRMITSALKGAIGGTTYGLPGAALQARSERDLRNQQVEANKAKALEEQQAGLGTEQQAQGDMFGGVGQATPYDARPPQGLTPREQDIAAQQQAEAMRQDPTAASERFYQQQQAPQPNANQQGLDLQGGMTAEQMQVEQRDRQNQEMNQLYMDEIAQKQQEAQARAQTAKQILDDEIALADERVRLGDLNRREAARLDLLHPVLENPSIGNTAAAFQANLKRAGYANTELTETEKALIQKADDMKAALLAAEQQPKAEEVLSEPEAEAETEYAAPNKLTPKVTGIPLKQEKGPAGEPKPKEPEQKYLKGIGRPQVGEEAQTEEAAPEPEYKTILDASLLDSTGLSKQSGFYRQLYNKDMANPQDQIAIGQTLAGIRTNPNLSPNTKQAVESIAMQAFNALAEQQKMFGPRGAVLKGAENGGVRTGPVNQAGGKSVPVPKKPRTVKATERTTAPKPRGVAPTERPAGGSGVREEAERSALERKLKARLSDLNDRLRNEADPYERETLRDEIENLRTELSDSEGNMQETIKSKPGANISRLADMFGPQLYGNMGSVTPVSVKEMVQNSFDAIKTMLEKGLMDSGEIDIKMSNEDRTISVKDNGSGMSPDVLANTFLTIAGTKKETEFGSGGFGVAKMLFLFGNKNVEVITVRDGQVSKMNTTGEQLKAALNDPAQAPDIEVTNDIDYDMFPEGHGTLVKVTVPELYTDHQTGTEEAIAFRASQYQFPVLMKSPLFANITVNFNGSSIWGMGKDFQADDYTTFVDAKFNWGTARIYVSNKQEDEWGENVHVLSNGLWQFSEKLRKDPSDSSSDGIPHRFFIDVVSKVKPDEAGYPFQFNRQGFTKDAEKDLKLIKNYIVLHYKQKDFNNIASSFGSVQYLRSNGKTIKATTQTALAPKVKEIEVKDTIAEGSKVEVVDGRLIVNGKEIPLVTPDDLKNASIDVDELKIPQEEVDPDQVMLHDNLEITSSAVNAENTERLSKALDESYIKISDIEDKIHELEFGPLVPNSSEITKLRAELNELNNERAELRDELNSINKNAPADTFVPITTLARDKFGKRFDKFMFNIGDTFMALRNAVVKVMPTDKRGTDYSELAKEAIGISFDKEYRGVSIRLPFHGLFINPAFPEYMDTPEEAAIGMFGTMIHELAHFKERNHNANFPAEMQRIIIKLEASPDFDIKALKNNFIKAVKQNKDIIDYLNKVGSHADNRPVGQRFKDGSYQTRNEALFEDVSDERSKGWGRSELPVELRPSYQVVGQKQQPAGFPAENTTNGLATFRNNPAAPGVHGSDAKSVFDSFVDKIQDAGILSPNRANDLHEVLKNTLTGNVRKAALSLLPVKALTEEAKRAGLKMAPQFNTIIDEHSGYVDGLNKSIEPLVRKAEDWAKTADKKQVDLFNKVVYDSTTFRIDPTKDKKEETTQADYDRIKGEYKKLTPKAQQLYKDMRNGYKAMYDEILASIEDRINTFVTDPATKAKIKKDILEKLAKRGEIDPYFALTRKGKYWLSYNLTTTRNGETTLEPYIEAYETQRERSKQIELLKKEGAESIQEFSQLSDYRYTNAPSGSFVNKILNILEVNRPKEPVNPTKIEQVKYDKELKAYNDNAQEVMNLYLSTLPETSFAQSFQKRKDTLGFRRDAVEALRDRMYNTSQQLGRMRYSAKLNKLLDDMREYSKAVSKGVGDKDEAGELLPARDNKALNDYISMFEKHANFIINPKISKISSMLNTIGFNYLLGFNISSAAVNLAQVPMIVAPYLAGEHGWGETMSAINDAYKLYLNSGYGKDARTVDMIGSTERVSMKAMPSIDNYGADTAAGKKYARLIEIAQKNGQLNRSQFYDVLEVDGRKNWSTTLNAATGFAFHHGERMNRQVSIVAAYNLQMNKLAGKVKDGSLTQEQAETQAAEYALHITEMTNGGVSSAGAPLIAKNNIGKVLFMFKRYGVSMYYMLFKITRDALKGESPEVRKAAMRQIAGVYGTAALFSGLQGIPMFGVAAMVYNLFADDDEDDMETATRKYVGEFAYKGMLNYVTGAEVASRFSMSDLIFRSNPSASSHTFEQGLLENLGGPVYGVASRIKRGLDMMNEGNMQRGVENILPSSISNILKSYRYGTDGAKSLRGDPIVEDVNAFSIAAQALGFAPAEYVRQLEINSQLKGVEKNILQKKSKLLQQYNIAKRMGDNEEAAEHKQELLELNKKHPKLEITADTFERSERAFKAATKRTVNGVQFSQKLYDEMMKNAAEYDR
jgi:hypothetical protein